MSRAIDLISALIGSVTLEVTPEELYKTSDSVIKEINDVQRSFERVYELVDGTNGYWNGKVSSYERKVLKDKKTEIDTIINNFSNYVEELNQIASNYIETEEVITESSQELPTNILS